MVMGSSLSKARDAGDERVSQRQRGLDTAVDTVVDTAKAAAEEELFLHPAAAIFRNETLAGIVDENAALEDNNSRFRHLPDFSQKLDIAFSTASSEFREGVRFITYHQNICVQTQLSHGSVVLVDGNERLVIPVNDANAHPIDDCGTIGNISSYLAGLQIGSFPLVRFYNVQNVVKIRIEDDGSIHFTLYLSPLISIEGRLDAAISNDALAAYFEREELINTMKLPIPLAHLHSTQEKGITFTLTSISVSLTSRVKKSLSYFSEASSPSDSDEVDKLRSIVVDALGESEHKEVLNKNLELKCESAALAGIRRMILGVDVSHSAGAFSVTLDEGEELKDSDLDKWIIELNGRDDISLSVPIADMGSIGISFSGMQLRMEVSETMLYARRAAEAMPIFFNDRIGRRISVILVGVFNWVDFSDDEISDIADDFGGKLRSVLEGNGEDVFPARMTFRMTHMFCPPMAEDLLKKVGPLKESDSNADE